MSSKKGYVSVIILVVVFLAMLGILGSVLYSRSAGDKPGGILLPTNALSQTPSNSKCDCAWAMSSSPNVEFLVISPSGQQTGYLQSENRYTNDIPDTSYGFDKGVAYVTDDGETPSAFVYFDMNNPVNGVYEIRVIGKEAGKYRLEVSIAWGPENTKITPLDGTININEIDIYTVTFPSGTVQKRNQ